MGCNRCASLDHMQLVQLRAALGHKTEEMRKGNEGKMDIGSKLDNLK